MSRETDPLIVDWDQYEDLMSRDIRIESVTVVKGEDISRLIRALEFYADPGTYFAIAMVPDPPCGELIEDGDEDYQDFDQTGCIRGWKPGKTARAALREWDKALDGDGGQDQG